MMNMYMPTTNNNKVYDAFGKEIHLYDYVVFNEQRNGRLYIGIVDKFTAKKVAIMTAFDGQIFTHIYKNSNRIAVYDR